MTEHEIRRMVVRLIGDGSSYFKMLDAAARKTSETHSTVQRYAKGIEAVGDSLTKFGKNAIAVGAKLTAAFTVPLQFLQLLAIKSGADFEQAFTGVRKTVDGTEEEMKTLELGIRNMALELPVAAKDLARIAEIGGQMGIGVKDMMEFTETVAHLSMATNLTEESAAELLGRFAMLTKLDPSNFDNFGSALNALGASSTSSEADIAAMANRIVGAGTSMGMTQQEILGVSTALSELGMEAEAGGTAFSMLLSEIASGAGTGGEAFDAMAKTAGMSSDAFKELFSKSAVSSVEALVNGLSKMDVFEREQALVAMGQEGSRVKDMFRKTGAAAGLIEQRVKLANEAFAENASLTKEVAKRQEDFYAQLQLVKNEGIDILIEAFGLMRDSLNAVMKSVRDGLKWIKSWSQESKIMAINIMKIVAVVGPLVIILGTLFVVAGSVVSAFGAIAGAIAMVSVPVWGIVAGITALVVALGAAVYWLIGSEGIINAFKILGARVQNFVITAVAFLKNFQQNIGILARWIAKNWQSLVGDLGELWGTLVGVWINNLLIGVETIVRIMTVLAGWMVGLFQKLWSVDFVNAIIQGIIEGAKALGNFATRAASAIRDALMGKGVDMSGFFAQMEGDFKKGAEDLNPLDALGDVIKEQMGKVEANMAGITNFKLKTALPELALGAIGAAPLNPLAQESALGAVADPLKESLQPGSEKMQAIDNLKNTAVTKTNETLQTIADGISKLVENSNKGLRNPTLDVEAAGLTE